MAVDETLANLYEVKVPKVATSEKRMPPLVASEAPEFVRLVTKEIMAGRGDLLPVSVFPKDGTFPVATSQWEKRNIALKIPVWEPDLCIQCGKCSIVCPHAAIRMKLYDKKYVENAPKTFKVAAGKGKQVEHLMCTVQNFPEDCTGCGACVFACPVKDKANPERKAINMQPQEPLRVSERENARFFLSLPETDPALFRVDTVKGSQLRRPLFEFSGACAGCGETPYIKLLTQLFGDRLMIGNATGCSSIYGGNLPTTPYAQDANGRGPVWSNSLFEDNAEFAYGMRLAVDKFNVMAREILTGMSCSCLAGKERLIKEILDAKQVEQADIEAQRQRVAELKKIIGNCQDACCQRLRVLADYLVKKSIWAVGGDGWAYDIGYGGLDHVLASGRNINALVLDTEVYSNTGGQASKSTPIGAVARFADGGKTLGKKDLALMAMTYGSVYVANVAMGANDAQTVKAFMEAEAYDGPSLIIAYSHCIAHGLPRMADALGEGMAEHKKAVECGHWPLFRFDPRRLAAGQNPLQLDSKPPSIQYQEFALGETRFRTLMQKASQVAERLLAEGDARAKLRFKLYEHLASMAIGSSAAQPQA